MNVYLACTVRGDRGGVAAARVLCDTVERCGHVVLTKHLLCDDADAAEASLGERAVFERDLQWLESADLLIAEASGSSYGVGFEVGYVLGRAAHTGQRVLLLYDAARRSLVSRLIAGNAHDACTTYAYRDTADLRQFVDGFLAALPSGPTECGRPSPQVPKHGGELPIRITRLHDDVPLPEYQTTGAAGFDLPAAEDVTIEPGQVKLVPTGLVIEVPPGMFLAVFARSSTPIKRGLIVSNGVGVVDSDYCGPADEVKIQVLNVTDRAVVVKAGDRIAQGIFLPAPRVTWQETAAAVAPSRGGFGSTDRER